MKRFSSSVDTKKVYHVLIYSHAGIRPRTLNEIYGTGTPLCKVYPDSTEARSILVGICVEPLIEYRYNYLFTHESRTAVLARTSWRRSRCKGTNKEEQHKTKCHLFFMTSTKGQKEFRPFPKWGKTGIGLYRVCIYRLICSS